MAAFVLGNGISRQHISVDHLMKLGSVYGCNGLYRTNVVTALIATDQPIAKEIQKSGYSKKHRFYTRRPVPDLGGLTVPKEYFGFSSGPIATAIAAKDHHKSVYLLGFDMAPDPLGRFNNIYAGSQYYKAIGATPTYTGNWIKQLTKIISDHPKSEFYRIIGETTSLVPELQSLPNYHDMAMNSFVERINNEKDL